MAFDSIKYVNGSTWEFDVETCPIGNINGLGLQANMLTISAPDQEGETYLDRIVMPRTVSMEFTLLAKTSELETEKRKVATALNPRLGMGTLYIERDGSTYCLDCKVTDFVQPGGLAKGHDFQQYIVNMTAPDPYFYLSTPTTVNLSAFTSGFEFDLEFPFSVGLLQSNVTINNAGNVPTPVQITLTGGISRPVIENGDDSIVIETTISEDETLFIDTKFGNKQMKSITTGSTINAFSYASTGSELWYLSTGNNSVSYINSGEVGAAEAKLVYYTRYNTI